MLAGLALGAGVAATTAGTWVRATTESAVDATVALTVAGTQAAPAAGAGALVMLAAAVALALGGRVGRWLALSAQALAGALVVVAAVAAVRGARGVAEGAARDELGVGVVTGQVGVSPLPWVAAVLGALAAVLAVATGVAARRWPRTTTRHEAPAQDAGAARAPRAAPARTSAGLPADADPADDWDALTRGEDPT